MWLPPRPPNTTGDASQCVGVCGNEDLTALDTERVDRSCTGDLLTLCHMLTGHEWSCSSFSFCRSIPCLKSSHSCEEHPPCIYSNTCWRGAPYQKQRIGVYPSRVGICQKETGCRENDRKRELLHQPQPPSVIRPSLPVLHRSFVRFLSIRL